MGFLSFCTRLAELTFGLHWLSSDRPNLQVPLSGIQPSHHVIEPQGGHDYLGDPNDWFCNSPTNRQCWINGRYTNYNIKTDYEAWWPTGVIREYWLNITYVEAAPDGYTRNYTLVNGTFPGPLIEANWGDTLIIHVTNYLKDNVKYGDNGTTIHWHGIRQWGSSEADGVNGVTQCPIVPFESYTYKWQATQYGHSWYHSHYSMQYGNGVLGPLLIHGPTSDNWDVDVGVISVGDLYHDNVFEIYTAQEIGDDDRFTKDMTGTNINGHGHFPCNATEAEPDLQCGENGGRRWETVFEAGKKYLLRIVNTSVDLQFRFAIDNHMLKVVQVDFVPVEPYDITEISIGIGQRYEVIVTAIPNATYPFPSLPPSNNFWIRTIPLEGCSEVGNSTFATYGVLRYDSQCTEPPKSHILHNISYDCSDEVAKEMVPIVPWQVGLPVDKVELDVGMTTEAVHGAKRFEIFETPLWLTWGDPTITNLHNHHWNPEYNVVTENNSTNKWVYFIIQGNFTNKPKEKVIPVAHPIHLHGHDFAILAQGHGSFDDAFNEARIELNFKNPIRRDVALLDSYGYLVIAWKTDNPGIWLLHCHIAWHASSGLALQVIERQREIGKTIENPEQIHNMCKAWNQFDPADNPVIYRDDSGI